MNTRRWATAVAALAALSIGTAGCNSSKTPDGTPATTAPSPTPAVDAKTALAKSALALASTSFKVSGDNVASSIQASIDPAAKTMTSKITQGDAGQQITVDVIAVTGDTYVKLGLGQLAQILGIAAFDGKWLHVDPTKLKDPKDFGVSPVDPVDAVLLFGAIVSAESTGPGAYKGTFDLTKAPKAGIVDEDTVTDLADAAKAVPFEATVDSQGRLSSLTIKVPTSGKVTAQTWKATFSDYGTPVTATKPTGAIETPANVYAVFNQ